VAELRKDFPWPPPRLPTWCAAVDADPSPTWLLPGIMPADASVLMSGKAKIGHKTWFAMSLAYSVASGKPWGPFKPDKPSPVLFAELEGPRKFTRRRWAAIAAGFGDDTLPDNLIFAHRYPIVLPDEAWQKRLVETIVGEGVKLFCLDTIAKAMLGDEKDSQYVNAFFRSVDVIRSAGCQTSCLYLHHLRKPGMDKAGFDTDIDDDIRGSTAFSGFYDVHYALRTPYFDDSVLWLTVRDAQGKSRYWHMTWDIAEDPPKAECKMQLLCDGKISPALLATCTGKLSQGKVYKPVNLFEAWELPGELCGRVRKELQSGGILEYTPRGYKATEGGT
jgi:hypothetical protein